ncbi:MAG: hypothetical protein KIH08_05885 [Candidatus Freyarchaeota archaeon]|nr:hypothetical protein [Candidatus Jordarchaeia archaeon]MBS7270404.1 hypothetical protein [Candidatus Jordarchaeia archaeon]
MVRKRTTYEGVQKVDVTVENDALRVMIIMLSGEESGKREERIITEEVANQVVVNNCRVKFVGRKATIDSPEGAIKISIDHDFTENIKNIEISQ